VSVTITLPTPGYYIVENLLTGTYGYTLTIASNLPGNNVICIDRGMCQHIYNDGTNVRFVNLGAVGQMELWAGYSAIPAWVSNCTVPPYLLCDGSVYNYSTYPALANRLGGTFGGNGVTTFGVPDLRGRVPLAYDGTGSRITAAVSGITGTSIGSSADNQGITLSVGQLPTGIQCAGTNNIAVYPSGNSGLYAAVSNGSILPYSLYPGSVSGSAIGVVYSNNANWSGTNTFSANNTITVTSNNTSNQQHSNVQPAQVVGIWVIRAA
jgi:microcystin-dependent protein